MVDCYRSGVRTVFGGDEVHDAVTRALDAIARGDTPPERRVYDFKEDAGRRQRDGSLGAGEPRSEVAAVALAPEVACMANTPGGGSLIVGISDSGEPQGTSLDADWLQLRLYQLLDRQITTVVTEHDVCGARVLVVRSPGAVSPVRCKGRVQWRVGDQCQEIDSATWQQRRAEGWGYDWSEQASDVPATAARPAAIAIARTFLKEAGDERTRDLGDIDTPDLLRRLGAATVDGMLTNAGAIAFAGRTTPALDYLRRPAAGADSEERVNLPHSSLLEELAAVFTTARAYNPETHIERGLVIGRVRALPERALREAIVNGVAHREWTDPGATTVEHIGSTLRVTSPGGFYGGVTPANILTHPSKSRNASLTALLALLGIAERQGIGVDRMYGDMLRLGHPLPTIEEADGNRVLVVLAGDRPDEAWMAWLRAIGPAAADDLRVLMSLHRLVHRWWTDATDLQPYLQITGPEAEQVIDRMRLLQFDGRSVVFPLDGVPASRGVVLSVTDHAWGALQGLGQDAGRPRPDPDRDAVASSYAEHFGRISTTELASIVGAHATNVGANLRRLEAEGLLAPSRANRRGPGFYYRWVGWEA